MRLLALCAHGDLTVSDLVEILGQSQPGVSRHLKLLCDAGLLERFPEGAWVFYRLALRGSGADTARAILALLPSGDPVLERDAQRLAALKQARAENAQHYFRVNASRWAELRSLHTDEALVETALGRLLGDAPLGDLLDIGTGTGRILQLLAPNVTRAEGIDASREMLALARSRIETAGLSNCQVRQGDMYRLAYDDASFDTVTVHQVLHFAENPGAALTEAARVLRPGGRLLVVDFAPHGLETLRAEHRHRRLGFSEEEVFGWCRAAGLDPVRVQHLPGDPLTVFLWLAARPAPGRSDGPVAIGSFTPARGDA